MNDPPCSPARASPPGGRARGPRRLLARDDTVTPVGTRSRDLVVLTRDTYEFRKKAVIPVRFVPVTGEAQQQ